MKRERRERDRENRKKRKETGTIKWGTKGKNERVPLGRIKGTKIKYQLYVARLKQARVRSLCKRVIYK